MKMVLVDPLFLSASKYQKAFNFMTDDEGMPGLVHADFNRCPKCFG